LAGWRELSREERVWWGTPGKNGKERVVGKEKRWRKGALWVYLLRKGRTNKEAIEEDHPEGELEVVIRKGKKKKEKREEKVGSR